MRTHIDRVMTRSVELRRAKLLGGLSDIIRNGCLKSTRKAFILIYLYIVVPAILRKVRINIRKHTYGDILPSIRKILLGALSTERLPVTVAKMVAITNILQPILQRAFIKRKVNNRYYATLLSSFVGALLAFPSFQKYAKDRNRNISLDLSLTLGIRATDTILSGMLPYVFKKKAESIQSIGDAFFFTLYSYLIMRSWFYFPARLPAEYRKWITTASSTEEILVRCCRAFRLGEMSYGNYGPLAEELAEFCRKHDQNPEKGDTVMNDPVSCELLHTFKCNSCEKHAMWRFKKGFIFALKLYGTLNLVLFIVRRKNLKKYLTSTFQSAAFLASFIFLNWYPRCLARNKVLPRLFPNKNPTFYEAYSTDAACMFCGLSCLIESPQRRKELTLFVAPKAIGTLISKESTTSSLIIERIIFSVSFAILATFAKVDPKRVRGIMGRGLHMALSN